MQLTKAKYIQLIHIAKQQLKLDDETYRAMLKRLTNKDSSTKLSMVELHNVLYVLKKQGADIHIAMNYRKQKSIVKPRSNITAKIFYVWNLMAKHGFLKDESENALNAYARKMINTGNKRVLILNVGALDNDDASYFVEILKKWHKRLMVGELEKQGHQVNKKLGYDSIVNDYEKTIFNV